MANRSSVKALHDHSLLIPSFFLFQLVKLCIAMIDTGKAFCVANKQFMNGIRDLAQYSSNDAVVEVGITKIMGTVMGATEQHVIVC
jgi:Arf-GAP/coiled-coil/ANK repeat/PH domain-containing protein